MMARGCVHVKLACTAVQGDGNLPKCADCLGAIIYPVCPITGYLFPDCKA